MFKSKLKANQLTFIDDTNTEYIVQDFEKQGFVAKTKEQLKQALTKLGANDGTIIITDVIYIDEDLTIPENVMLKFVKGGKLNVQIGYTLTLNCLIDAGLYHIFDGYGTVTGNPKIKAAYPEWFGAKGDGATDDTNALQKCSAFDKIVLSNKYKISGTINFNSYVYSKQAEIIIDENGDFSTGSSLNNVGVLFGKIPENTFVINTTTAAQVNSGDIEIYVQDASQFNPNDVICIWDSSIGSFSQYRDYYYNGEYVEIQDVDYTNNIIKLKQSIVSSKSYPVGTYVYKMDYAKVSLDGELIITTPKNVDALYPLHSIAISCCYKSSIDKITLYNGNAWACSIIKSYKVSINEIVGYNDYDTTISPNNYLVTVGNSQEIYHNKIIGTNWWHTWTCGGNDSVCSVVNRQLTINYIKTEINYNTAKSAGYALDVHGNIDGFIVNSCNVNGGVVLAGNNTIVKGICYTNRSGIGLYFTEMSGYNHDASQLTIYGVGDYSALPSSRAIVDLGANSSTDIYAYNGGNIILPKNIILLSEENTSTAYTSCINITIRNANIPDDVAVIADSINIGGNITKNILIIIRSISAKKLPRLFINNIKYKNHLYLNLSNIEQCQGVIENKYNSGKVIAGNVSGLFGETFNVYGSVKVFSVAQTASLYNGTSVIFTKQHTDIRDSSALTTTGRLYAGTSNGSALSGDLNVYYVMQVIPTVA